MSYSVIDIDTAWKTLLETLTLSDAEPIHIFVEKPATIVAREKKYPAITVSKISIIPDSNKRTGNDGDLVEDAYDTGTSPATATTTRAPSPYRIIYAIDTWTTGAKKAARHDAELMEGIFTLIDSNGVLVVVGDGGVEYPLDVFQTFSTVVPSAETSERVIHRSWTFEVRAQFTARGSVEGKRAETVQLTIEKAETVVDGKLDRNDTVVDITLELP